MECDHFWKISAGSLNPRVATKAVTAVMMHGVKSVVYQHYIRLEQVWVLAVALELAVILGPGPQSASSSRCQLSVPKFVAALLGADFAANAALWMRATSLVKLSKKIAGVMKG